jgi:hypothetical protein
VPLQHLFERPREEPARLLLDVDDQRAAEKAHGGVILGQLLEPARPVAVPLAVVLEAKEGEAWVPSVEAVGADNVGADDEVLG